MKIGRVVFYDVIDGSVILITSEYGNATKRKTIEEQITTYREISERNRETFDVIELEYGQYRQDLADSISYRVNPDTQTLEFMYPDPNAPEEPAPEPVYQAPLSEVVKELKQENTLIKAQNQALTERADFIEDVVAEMATQVYQ